MSGRVDVGRCCCLTQATNEATDWCRAYRHRTTALLVWVFDDDSVLARRADANGVYLRIEFVLDVF